MSRKVTLGLIQMSMEEDADVNLSKAIRLIDKAAKKGAQIICLPELFRSPYFPQKEDGGTTYAEKIPGPTSEALSQAAKDNEVIVIGGSIFEKTENKLYNTSMVFDERGKSLGIYRKIHIPHDENFFEQSYFSPGDRGYLVCKTKYAKIGVMICYDQWYPEAARINALMGAEIIFYPTAIGLIKGVRQKEGNWHSAWETVQRGHAIANGIIVAAVNRVGTEKNMVFWGRSFVSDAFGKILIRGSKNEEIIITNCDVNHGKEVREGWRFFYNRRPETYYRLVE